MKPISDVARTLDIDPNGLEPYGHYKAKLPPATLERLSELVGP